MNSLELMKLNKSRMNFVVEKLCNTNKDIKVAIHKNNSVYSIDKNKNVFKIISETNKSAVGSEEIFDTLNSKQLVNLFDNKYKLIIPNKLNNTLTCVAANHLTTEKIGNQNVSTNNNIATKLVLNNKTDEFVSIALDQRSKINAASYKIFEDSVKNLGVKIIDALQSIINPNFKINNSVVSREGNKPTNDLAVAVKETVEDVNLKKVSSVLTGNSKLLFKIGDMIFSIKNVGIIYTSDGENWTSVEGEISSKSIKTTFKLSNYLIALCTDNSFYYSLNGVNWTRIADSNNYSSPSVNIDDLFVLPNSDCAILKIESVYYTFNTADFSISRTTIPSKTQKSSNNTLFYSKDEYYTGTYTTSETSYIGGGGGSGGSIIGGGGISSGGINIGSRGDGEGGWNAPGTIVSGKGGISSGTVYNP